MDKPNPDIQPDEISLGEFLRGIAVIIRWAKSNLLGLAICWLIGGGLGLGYTLTKEDIYPATLTFVLSDNNTSSIGGFGGILTQLGIPITTGRMNIDKLLEIARSRRISGYTLLRETDIDGRTDVIGNHLIDIYGLRERWSSDIPTMASFRFEASDSLMIRPDAQFAVKQLYRQLIGTPADRDRALVRMDYGNPDYVMSITTSTRHPDLSIQLAELIYEELESFYAEKSTEQYQSAYELIKSKRDSISSELELTEVNLARLQDRSANTFANASAVQSSRLSATAIGLRLALQKVEENLAVAEYALQTNTPIIQLIDSPMAPITPQRPSVSRYVLIGVIIGTIAYIGLYLGRILVSLV